jgi:hypothetical protein
MAEVLPPCAKAGVLMSASMASIISTSLMLCCLIDHPPLSEP